MTDEQIKAYLDNLSEEEKQKIVQKFVENVSKGVKYHSDRMNDYLKYLAARL